MPKKKEKIVNIVNIKKDYPTIRLDKFIKQHYYRYGVAVNEDRAIPSPIDGLKPVGRRALWAGYKLNVRSNTSLEKSALIVGDMIGKYHPHGDTGSYKAIVTMVNSCVPLFEGVGNWGSFAERNAAAMRYTNTRLSKFSDKVYFDPFYIPCMELIPNFDGKRLEPVILPALLPTLLLNGADAIGVGIATKIPAFTLKSVLEVLKNIFEKKEVVLKDLEKLVFNHSDGAIVHLKGQKEQFRQLLSTGKGKIVFNSVYTLDEKDNTVTVTGFAFDTMQAAIKKILKLKDIVVEANDISEVESKYCALEIQLKKSLKGETLKAAVEKIEKNLIGATSFNIKVTERKLSETKDEVDVKLADYSIETILNKWYEYRIHLEKTACDIAIKNCEEKIIDLELKIKAVDFIDEIVKLLKTKGLDDKAMSEKLSKVMKVSVDDAFKVLCMQVRHLKSLEKQDMLNKISDLQKEIKGFNKRIKNPDEYILTTLKDFEKLGD